jgi:hypothetical protein
VSDQQAEVTHGESGSVSTGSSVSPPSEPSSEAAAAADIAASVLAAPAIAPDHETPLKDDVKHEATPEAKIETPRIEVPAKSTPRGTGKVLIMAPSDRTWHDHTADVKVDAEARAKANFKIEHKADLKSDPKTDKPKRSFPAMAAMLALATIAGAVGGVLATTGLTHVADAPANNALEASIARIDSDVLALKAGLEHTSKTSVSQFNKTSDRLDKIEKAQTEPNAKLAKLTEAVDKLRTPPPAVAAAPAQAVAVTPATAKEVTGSVTTPAGAAPLPAQVATVPAVPPKSEVKPDVNRLPSVDGWKLADVGYGGALIENRRGTYEVYAGDVVPGLGRIDAIRKQDGHWVVVTQKGLILPR